MDAQDYEAWYHTTRGRWIGDVELDLLKRLLRPEKGESLLDVGCGTGYFTGRFADESDLRVIGLDPDMAWLRFARACDGAGPSYCSGRAERLPFPDRSFDRTVLVAALCFIHDQRRAVCEILRVTRKRFAIGLLNRHSLLYLRKGTRGGSGATAERTGTPRGRFVHCSTGFRSAAWKSGARSSSPVAAGLQDPTAVRGLARACAFGGARCCGCPRSDGESDRRLKAWA